MDIQFMEVPSTNKDAEGNDLTIIIDNETVIRVRNYGSGLYEWRVDLSHLVPSDSDPTATLTDIIGKPANEVDGWFTAAQTFGPLATWWDPRTFAHAVMDVLHNQ